MSKVTCYIIIKLDPRHVSFMYMFFQHFRIEISNLSSFTFLWTKKCFKFIVLIVKLFCHVLHKYKPFGNLGVLNSKLNWYIHCDAVLPARGYGIRDQWAVGLIRVKNWPVWEGGTWHYWGFGIGVYKILWNHRRQMSFRCTVLQVICTLDTKAPKADF